MTQKQLLKALVISALVIITLMQVCALMLALVTGGVRWMLITAAVVLLADLLCVARVAWITAFGSSKSSDD